MKKRLFSFMLAACLLLISCTANNAPHESAGAPPQPEENESEPAAAEPVPDLTEHPMHAWGWVDNAETVAVESEGMITYLGLDNRAKESYTVDPALLPPSYRVVFGDEGFFILHEWGEANDDAVALKTADGWQLFNGSAHKRNGETLAALPTLALGRGDNDYTDIFINGEETEYTTAATPCEWFERAVWIDGDTVALIGHARLFFYRPSTGELRLRHDCSAIIPDGKGGVYYGMQTVVPMAGGAVYLVYDESGLYNNGGHVYFTSWDTDPKLLNGGELIGSLFGSQGLAFTQTYEHDDSTGNTKRTALSYCTDGENFLSLPAVEGWAFYHQATKHNSGHRILWEGTPAPDNLQTFYVFDTASGEFSSYTPPEGFSQNPELVTVRGEEGCMEYVFCTSRGTAKAYSEVTGEITDLVEPIWRWNDEDMFSSPTHYIKFSPDVYEMTHLTVREIR